MRNMAFSLTTNQMYSRSKTVTRRLGWWFLNPGDIVMAVEKGMGLKKGEHVKRIYPIRIMSTGPEPLVYISKEEVVREGFPEMTCVDFINMFCEVNRCNPLALVNRIEFQEVMGPLRKGGAFERNKMNVVGMIEKYLKDNGYDGLYNSELECACLSGDLIPCNSDPGGCKPGYRTDCDCSNGCSFHVSALEAINDPHLS
jgi:hypothetical protein